MSRSSDITSFTEHRRHLRHHLDQVRRTGRPLYITSNGAPDAVLMSPEAYDELADKAELLESLARMGRGVAEIRDGRTAAVKPALKKLAQDLGLTLDR